MPSSPPPHPDIVKTAGPQAQALVALPGYQPSGGIGPLSWPLIGVTALIAPGLAAWIYDKTLHFGTGLFSSMWAFLIGAALLGALTGAAFFPAIHFGKIRSANLAALLAGLAGLLAFSFALGAEAQSHRGDIKASRIQSIQKASATTKPNSRLDLTRQYLDLRAESGLEVTGRRGRREYQWWNVLGASWHRSSTFFHCSRLGRLLCSGTALQRRSRSLVYF